MNLSLAARVIVFLVLAAAPGWANQESQQPALNASQAVGFWRMGADQGDVNAQAALGHFYAVGMVVPRDDVEAYKWYSLAAKQGNEDAKQQLAEMDKTIKPEEKAEAQKRASEWKPKGK